jgi:hypothetical protein
MNKIMQEHWPVHEPTVKTTPLYACAQWRKLKLFLPAVRNLLSISLTDADNDSETVVEMLRTRVLPELNRLREEDVGHIRREVVRLVLELSRDREGQQREFLLSQLLSWVQNKQDWKHDVEEILREIVSVHLRHIIIYQMYRHLDSR